MDEFAPAPPGGATSTRLQPKPVRVIRKTAETVVTEERRNAVQAARLAPRLAQHAKQGAPGTALLHPTKGQIRSVILVRKPAAVDLPLEEGVDDVQEPAPLTSIESMVNKIPLDHTVPKSRTPLHGKWGTPAETKIVAKWSDGVSSKPLRVVQVLTPRRVSHELQEKEVILVSGLDTHTEE